MTETPVLNTLLHRYRVLLPDGEARFSNLMTAAHTAALRRATLRLPQRDVPARECMLALQAVEHHPQPLAMLERILEVGE